MKKKGLIVATIVMVLVLAVSLTTATYAWFTANSVTTIEAFTLSIASDNDVNIGFLANYANVMTTGTAKAATKEPTNYVTGDCTYTFGTAGQLGGSWSGISGLSATLNHDILWGAQSKAVAVYKSSPQTTVYQHVYNGNTTYSSSNTSLGTGDVVTPVDAANYADNYTEIGASGAIDITSNVGLYAANLSSGKILDAPAAAYANYKDKEGSTDAEKNGDYVHMVLGAQVNSSETIDCNILCIAVDWSGQTSAYMGALTAIHVAYRTAINGAAGSAWTDVDLFGNDIHYNTPVGTPGTNINNGTAGSQPQYQAAYEASYGSRPSTSHMITIPGLSTTSGAVDQIELVIYLDGNDGDCNNYAINNIAGALKIFFCTSNGNA